MPRDPITTLRDLDVMQVPSGFKTTLPKGSWLIVQQALGGQFTALTEIGGLVRVDGKDADALGPAFVEVIRKFEEERSATSNGAFDEEKVWEALRQVYDPEIPANIVDLGLVYLVASEPVEDGHKVTVKMTLTAPACGIGPVLIDDVRHRTLAVPGVKDVNVELVFDPPWDPSRMSEAAKLQLGFM